MTTKKKSAGVSTYWIGGGAALVALGAAATGYMIVGGSPDRAKALPKEMSVSALKAQAETDPAKMMDTFRETMRRDDLTDEQRREIGSNMRQVWQSMMTERIDEWYAAQTEDEKVAVLDRQIDEFAARMSDWQRRREEREREGEQASEEERERMRQMWSPPTREERKARSESRNPDQMARSMVYFAAMRSRMDQRGIQMPRGGPGGRGMGAGGGGRRGP
jgi:hypothetical protein